MGQRRGKGGDCAEGRSGRGRNARRTMIINNMNKLRLTSHVDLPPKISREEQESRLQELNQPTRGGDDDAGYSGQRVDRRGGTGENLD